MRRVGWVPWARAFRSQRVKAYSQGHGKRPEVHCQDCDGAGRERGRCIQDAKQNPHRGWVIEDIKRRRYYEKPHRRQQGESYEICRRIYNMEMTRKINFLMRKNRAYPWQGC